MSTVIFVDTDATGLNDGASWSNAYTTLQDALAAAVSGDEIWVAAGTYTPGTARTDTFQLISGVKIYGGFTSGDTQLSDRDPDPATNGTVLSGDINGNDTASFGNRGDNSYRVVNGSGTDSTALLDGFTISGGNADAGSGDDRFGAGIFNNGGSPTLQNLIIQDNEAARFGGGVFNGNNSNPTLTNVIVDNNRCRRGGGGIANDNSHPTLTNVTITGNRMNASGTSGPGGGGMYNTNSNPTLTNVTITGNQSDSDGGGMSNTNGSSPHLTNVMISGNRAEDGDGGGMYNFSGSDPVLTNVTLTGNRSDEGGGMYNGFNSSPTLINVTITGNKSRFGNGGGILNRFGSNPTLQNSIIWGNVKSDDSLDQVVNNDSSTTTYSYTLVQDLDLTGQGAGNLDGTTATADFVAPENPANAPTTVGDYRLQSTSDAIDAGDNSFNTILTELDGNPRVIDGDGDSTATIDIGAYEYAPILAVPLVFGQPATGYIDSGGNLQGDVFGAGDPYTGDLFTNTDTTANPDDVIAGTPGDDNIWPGETGNDIIDAGAGNDTIGMGTGDVTVFAGDGDDFVYSIAGGGGTNVIDLGEGNNETWLESGNNDITAGSGDDVIGLGDGIDRVDAGDGNNTVYMVDAAGTTDGAKDILTGLGNDWVQTGSGDDRLNLGTNAGNSAADFDIAFGQGGSDTFVLNEGSGFLTVGDFAQGEDLLEISGITFADIGSSVDVGRNSTWVWDNVSGDVLAELQGFTGTLTAGDFAAV